MSTLEKRIETLERQKASSPIIEDEDFRILAMSGLSHETALAEIEKYERDANGGPCPLRAIWEGQP